MARSYTITQSGESRSYTIDDGVGAPGSDAEVTLANVRAAGALMDDEVTNLAQVKAFSSADYATAAQGTLAASASQPGHTHVSADVTDATTDGFVNPSKLLKTDALGATTVETIEARKHKLLQGSFKTTIQSTTLTGNQVLTTPDETGTIALTSDSRFTDERVPTAAGLTSKFGTNKATLADGDKVAILDSAASDAPKHGLLSAIWAYIKAKIESVTLSTVAISGDLTVDTSTLFVDATTNRVGIGTASPRKALSTIGTIGVDTTSSAVNYATREPVLIFQRSDLPGGENSYQTRISSSFSGLPEDSTLNFELAGSGGSTIQVMTMTGDGRVGIGTASPATAFSVSGTITTTGNIELGHASDTTLSRSAAGVLAVEGVVIPSISSTNTLTNKRITNRVTTITSSATPTINTDDCDCVTITALATAITSMTTNLSGTPTNFQQLLFRIKDDGTARAITWGASFVARGGILPSTTTASKVWHVLFIYNTVSATWDCVSSSLEV